MKVKIKDKIYDAELEPILIILNDSDKKNISKMLGSTTKYCSFPINSNLEEIKQFMKIESE